MRSVELARCIGNVGTEVKHGVQEIKNVLTTLPTGRRYPQPPGHNFVPETEVLEAATKRIRPRTIQIQGFILYQPSASQINPN